MSKATSRAATPALRILQESGLPYQVSTFDGGTDNFGERAAQELGLDPDRVFKTLLIDLHAGKGPKPALAVCVLPVSYRLSLKKAAAALGAAKAAMADPHDAAKSTGYVPGGISPLGQKHQLPTVIDESAQMHESIFFSGGRRGLDVEMAAGDLASLAGATFADLLAD